ncbi:hypothetical protein PR048_003116 [Dryococelus australis]|uniref:Uncharacterized protein n=1 Tax=Dryococelus australis TaxID=614101 RepID=A0ABQ9IM49_9NEOP|nr:hypothetical protein PR048_003116 [Dryococelus australis]
MYREASDQPNRSAPNCTSSRQGAGFHPAVDMARESVELVPITDITISSFACMEHLRTQHITCKIPGPVTYIVSDCGTTFVEATLELNELLTLVKLLALVKSEDHHVSIKRHLAEQGISWHFNPPAAPHQG